MSFSSDEVGVVVAITVVALIVGGRVGGVRCAISSGLDGLSCGLAGAAIVGVIGALLGIVVVGFVSDNNGGSGGFDIDFF